MNKISSPNFTPFTGFHQLNPNAHIFVPAMDRPPALCPPPTILPTPSTFVSGVPSLPSAFGYGSLQTPLSPVDGVQSITCAFCSQLALPVNVVRQRLTTGSLPIENIIQPPSEKAITLQVPDDTPEGHRSPLMVVSVTKEVGNNLLCFASLSEAKVVDVESVPSGKDSLRNAPRKITKLDLLKKCKELGIKGVSIKKKNDILLLIKEYESNITDLDSITPMKDVCKDSKNIIETIVPQDEELKEVYDYIPYTDDDLDYLYARKLEDIITDEVRWTCFPNELLSIIEDDGKRYITLAKKMKHSLLTQWGYTRHCVKTGDGGEYIQEPKRKVVYNKLVYKYIYDHKMCLNNFFGCNR